MRVGIPALVALLAAACGACALSAGAATAPPGRVPSSFTIQDSVVSDPNADIPDPEFDNIDYRMAFNDATFRLWVCRVDSVTGAIFPRTGRGILVDSTVSNNRVNGIYNGPEWGYSQSGAEVVYTDAAGSIPVLARATGADSVWTHTQLDSGAYRALPLASKDRSFPSPLISYFYASPTDTAPAWRDVADPTSEEILTPTGGGSGGRWIDGRRAFTINGPDADSVLQAFIYDCDAHAYTQLTTDAGDKTEPWVFPAPEFDGEYVLMCLLIEENALAVYRSIDGVWTRINTITVPGRYPYLLSPEPFTYRGRSYAFLQNSSTLTQQNAAADIWLVALAPGPLFARPMSDTTIIMARRDPEVLVSQQGPFIYYTEVTPPAAGVKHVLHRCATGLLDSPPTAVAPPRAAAALSITAVSQQPGRGPVTFSYSLAAAARAQLAIVDVVGREVASLVDGAVDAGPHAVTWNGRGAAGRRVPVGIYFARLTAGTAAASCRLVLLQ